MKNKDLIFPFVGTRWARLRFPAPWLIVAILASQCVGLGAPNRSTAAGPAASAGGPERALRQGSPAANREKGLPGAKSSAPSPASPSTLAEWEAKALADYPELGAENSVFNRIFREQVTHLRQTSPDYFNNPSWPYLLAIQTSQALLAASPVAPVSHPVQGKETSAMLSTLCARAIEAKIKSKDLAGHKEDWIAGGKMIRGKKSDALYMGIQSIPEFVEPVSDFVRGLLDNPNPLHTEDRQWITAILVTPTERQGMGEQNPRLRSVIAEKLGIEEAELVAKLLPKLEDASWMQELLKEPTLHSNPDVCPLSLEMRADLLIAATKASFNLGKTPLPKKFCLNELRLAVKQLPENHPLTGEAIEVFERMPLSDWPEELCKPMRAPNGPFIAGSENWKKYVDWLTDRGRLARDARYPVDSSYNGRIFLLEAVLIKRLMKAVDMEQEPKELFDAIASEVRASEAHSASNALRIFPALVISSKSWPQAKHP